MVPPTLVREERGEWAKGIMKVFSQGRAEGRSRFPWAWWGP